MSEPTENNFINVLIAEDNDVSRELMAGILKTQGYNIIHATDGQSAIDVIQEKDIDMAFVDINMAPKGGFEFVEYMLVQGIKVPVVIVTGDDSSDILMKANALGISQILQKPVDPKRLVQIAHRVLKRQGLNPTPMGVESYDTKFSHEALMKRAISIAEENVKSGKGQPFGAVVADKDGRILGEGANGIASRADPTAHAEVMAIRQASEKLGKTDLTSCLLYCASEPTMMGKALVVSVGIEKVFFGLSADELNSLRKSGQTVGQEMKKYMDMEFEKLCHEEAEAMFTAHIKSSNKT